jgi:hypothetical protein
MSETNRSWLRNLLAVPLVVGLVIAVFTYALPKVFSESRQISYLVEEPVAYLDKTSIGTAVIKVNDIAVPEVFAARVRVWNSGSLPLKDLGIRFEFSPVDKDFRILSVNHNTRPAKEFGEIAEQGSDANSQRFVYALLNCEDEDNIVFLTSAKADVKVFSKAEGLSVKAISPEKRGEFKWYHAAIGAMLASLLSTFVEIGLKGWRERRRKRKERDQSKSEI